MYHLKAFVAGDRYILSKCVNLSKGPNAYKLRTIIADHMSFSQ